MSNHWVQLLSYLVLIPLVYSLARRNLARNLRLSELKYQSTVENAVEGIIQTSREGKFIAVNPAFAKMLGYADPKEMMTKISEIDRQIYVVPEVRREFLIRLERDKKARCEYEAFKKDGTTTWLLASSRVVEDAKGRFQYYESIVEDISHHRKRQQELEQLAESLARSNMELERFAHTVAHDLAEPMRTVTTYTQLMERELKGMELTAAARQHMTYVISAVRRMRELINDILSFSQYDWRVADVEPVDVSQLVAEVAQDLKASFRESGAKLEVGPLPFIPGDKAKLFRLFQNLISNSIKFRQAKPPEISVSAVPQGSHWLFMLRDNGIGFDSNNSEKIFDLFTRLADRNKYAGSGMGLATCKRIVELHGGRIWAESKPGEGSTFFFTLSSGQDENMAQPAVCMTSNR